MAPFQYFLFSPSLSWGGRVEKNWIFILVVFFPFAEPIILWYMIQSNCA